MPAVTTAVAVASAIIVATPGKQFEPIRECRYRGSEITTNQAGDVCNRPSRTVEYQEYGSVTRQLIVTDKKGEVWTCTKTARGVKGDVIESQRRRPRKVYKRKGVKVYAPVRLIEQ